MYKDFFNKITNGLLFTDNTKYGNSASTAIRAKKSSVTDSIQSRRSHFSDTEEQER